MRTPDDQKALAQAWKQVDPIVIMHIARMVKLGQTPAQILAEAMLMKLGKEPK